MLKLLADENFNGNVLRAVVHSIPSIDLVRVQDVGLDGAEDPEILEWAASNDRIVLTHDRATMPDFAYSRLDAGEQMPGVFVVDVRQGVRAAVDALLLIETCSELDEWMGRVVYLPL